MKIKKIELILIFFLIIGGYLRFYKIEIPGYINDELLMIAGGIKYFLPSSYNPSLYDVCLPGAKIWMGLFNIIFSNKNFSEISEWGIRNFGIVTINTSLLENLELFSRLPSAFMGIISGIFIYLLVKKMYGIKSGLFASSFFIFNSLLITYSRFALGEIYQITYMIISIYFVYNFLEEGKLKDLIISSIFLGATISTKLNALLLLPFFIILLIKKSVSIKKKSVSIKKNYFIKITLYFVLFLSLSILFFNGFDLKTVIEISSYFNENNYNTLGFYFFNLINHAFFYINPIIWICLIISVYFIFKEKNYFLNNDFLSLMFLIIIFVSSFFYTHNNMKRGIQFILFLFIVSSRFLSNKNKLSLNSKVLNIFILVFLFIDIGFLFYYHPNVSIYTNILCRSQECIEKNALFSYDSRIIGSELNKIDPGLIYDVQLYEGYLKYYIENKSNYLSKSLLYWYYNIKEIDYYFLKENNFRYVVKNYAILNNDEFYKLNLEYFGCNYIPINVKNFEMSRIYDLSKC